MYIPFYHQFTTTIIMIVSENPMKKNLVNFRWFPSASTFFIAAASACPTFGSKAACLKPQRA